MVCGLDWVCVQEEVHDWCGEVHYLAINDQTQIDDNLPSCVVHSLGHLAHLPLNSTMWPQFLSLLPVLCHVLIPSLNWQEQHPKRSNSQGKGKGSSAKTLDVRISERTIDKKSILEPELELGVVERREYTIFE